MSGAAKSRHRSRSTIRAQCAKPPTHSTDTCCAIKAASADAIAASRTRSLTSGCFPTVQRIGCVEEAIARPRRKLRTEGERGRRTLLARHRHVHVDERDLDAGLRGQSKGFEDRVARHERHHRAHRGSSATLEGRHRRRPAARGPFERRPERRGQFQRHHGGPRRGELLVDNPAEGRRRSDTTARPSGCGTSGRTPIRCGRGAQATASSSTCSAARASGVSTPSCFSFCAYWASESMSRVLSCRPCLTRFFSSVNTSPSS